MQLPMLLRTLTLGLAALLLCTSARADVSIVCLGDSGIRGKGVPEEDAYPAQLERALRAKGHHVTVSNEGINGDSVQGVLKRLDWAVPVGTNIVVLHIGGIDRKNYRPESYISQKTKEIIDRLTARGAVVVDYSNGAKLPHLGPEFHVEPQGSVPDWDYHLNAAGYAIIVRFTLPRLEALVAAAEKHNR